MNDVGNILFWGVLGRLGRKALHVFDNVIFWEVIISVIRSPTGVRLPHGLTHFSVLESYFTLIFELLQEQFQHVIR